MSFRPLAACLSLYLSTGVALACPLCDGETGRQVQAGIFESGDFFSTLLAIGAPFPVLAVIVAMIHFGRPRRQRDRASKL